IVITAFVLIFAQFALVMAEDTPNASSGAVVIEDNEPSINPDSFFWGFKDALDKFSLALTFNSESKAKKSITIAEERLREFQKMAEEGKINAAEKAKESHEEFLEKAKSAAKSISKGNKTEEIKKQIEIEREVEKLRNKTEIMAERLKIKIMTEGKLTAEQKALIGSLIASMQNQTGSLKIEINKNKEKIKIEIKARTNKTKEEIEDAVEKIEKEHNITKGKLDEAFENIIDAREEIAKLNDEIGMNNITDNAALILLNNSLDKLAAAQDAIDSSKYGEAYGLANAAKQLAENAREKIKKLTEDDGEREREKERNQTRNETKEREPKMCAQVITPAKNEKTGECKEFPTPCDVPAGWEKVNLCVLKQKTIVKTSEMQWQKIENHSTTEITANKSVAFVSRVIDGDSIELQGSIKVRLLGINTPERGQPYYQEANNRLRELIESKNVILENDIQDKDQYGRLLRYLFINDSFVNSQLVKEGYANVYIISPNKKYESDLRNAETEAKALKLNVWKQPSGEGICDNQCIGISYFKWNAEGDDCNNLNDEYVTLINSCSYPCDLTSWTVKDESSRNPYIFPTFVLESEKTVTLYTGCGTNRREQLYWCSRGYSCNAIWNNNGDVMYVRNSNGELVLNYAYA
ncbi:MAG: thermonuclease family protein, partial [Nanoarchaeota archaeon]|nr:thermonuclease family protein [Nanoarchaeota archaeon]